MASATPHTYFPVDRLPDLVLDRICYYLDDESDDRRDLWAFSLTCRRYCEAADKQRFCQIVVVMPFVDALDGAVARLREVLGHGRRYAYVRRLRVQGDLPDRDRYKAPEDEEEDQPRSVLDSKTEHVFDVMHPFCRLREDAPWYYDNGDRPDAWQLFADLLRDLPALRDLVWTQDHLPRAVLDAVHAPRARPCRLHMSACRFKLHSLVYDRSRPQSISADEYALITSPSLYSVSARVASFDDNGSLDYNDHALQHMMTGLAPNLTNVWLTHSRMGHTLALHNAYRLGRPEWGGFFIGADEHDAKGDTRNDARSKGAPLQNVKIDNGMSADVYQSWSTANLRRLHIQWTHSAGLALADLAVRGELASLETLCLTNIYNSSDPAQAQLAMHQTMSNVVSLRHLRLSGCITKTIFDVITHCHGASLRSLYLDPYDDADFYPDEDVDGRGELFVWSTTTVQQLIERCPLLEAVFVEMERTRGDRCEVAMYRALGTMPNMKHLLLHLRCAVDFGPDVEVDDAIPSGSRHTPPVGVQKATFTNAAVDDTLAHAIFDVISRQGQGRLQMLHLVPRIHTQSTYELTFYSVVRALTLPWACSRRADGTVGVEAMKKHETKKAIVDCGTVLEYNQNCFKGQEHIYPDVFLKLWPGRGPWWEGWTSLPLDLS